MTVSRSIRNPDQVSDTLRDRIQAALDELGYIPNRAPDILSKSKSHAIGVLLPSLTNQVFAEVIRGVESVLEPEGYQTMLAHFGYSKEVEEKRIETLLSYNVDALIISDSVHTPKAQKMLENAEIAPLGAHFGHFWGQGQQMLKLRLWGFILGISGPGLENTEIAPLGPHFGHF